MRMNICIVDDDKDQLKLMIDFIKANSIFNQSDIFSFVDSSDAGIVTREYDLYFLDIDMPKIDGFKLATKIQKKYPDAIFIFVSSHNEFVYDIFKFSAFYFVRKDSFESDMMDALNLASEKIKKKEERYLVKIKGDKVFLKLSDIIYFEKIKNKLLIVTKSYGELYEVKSLKDLRKEIDFDRNNFCMINSGMCVNLNCVERLNGYDILMKSNIKLTVSRRFLHNVKIDYQRYLMEREL